MSLYDDTLALLQRMVRNACVNDLTPDSGQEVRNADTLEEFFSGTDVEIQRIEPHPGRVSVVFTVPGTDPAAEPLTLLGHTDVVPVDAAKWTVDPFGAEIIDGKIYGRGTVDMLFITATMAAVTREIARHGRPRGTLTFVGLADEEARGGLGAKCDLLFSMIEKCLTGKVFRLMRIEQAPVEGAVKRAKTVFESKMK